MKVDENTPVIEPEPKKYWNIVFVAISCFFITVASILGTGILALPVKLEKPGFFPFLTTFSICLIAQSFSIIFIIELLQKTQVIQESQNEEPKEIQLEEIPKIQTTKAKKSNFLSEGPDLHSMGKLFLNRIFQIIFDICVIMHFVSVLISYALAGPEAYRQLIFIITKTNLSIYYFIPTFIVVLFALVIFGARIVEAIITFMTLIKGSMLIAMIGVVAYAGVVINLSFTDDWRYTGRPFLIGTVALGGAVNTIPLIYSKMEPTVRNLRIFRIAALLALGLCWILNVLWAFFILKIVPQTINPEFPNNPSLEAAGINGQSSTVPLVTILNTQYKNFTWVSYFIAVFIMISITVSFIAMSSGLKHMLDGYVKTFTLYSEKEGTYGNKLIKKCKWFGIFLQFSLYFISFSLVLTLALLNPKSFLIILEVFTSLALNLESGFFIAWMLWTSRRYYKEEIPLPLPNWFVYPTILFTMSYFLFACFYDVGYHITAIFVDPMPF